MLPTHAVRGSSYRPSCPTTRFDRILSTYVGTSWQWRIRSAAAMRPTIRTGSARISRSGLKPPGIDLFDVSKPEQPRLISHFDVGGPHSLGVHCLWFVDGEYVHMSSGAPDHKPRNPKDHQTYPIIALRHPAKPQ